MRSLIERLQDIDFNNISSEKLNQAFQAITNDIIVAYNELEDRTIEMEKLNQLLYQENRNLNNQLISLVENTYGLLNSPSGTKVHYNHYFDTENITSETTHINEKYGLLSPKLKYNSKIILSDYSKKFLLENFDIELKIFNQNDGLVKSISLRDDSSLINMFTGNTSEVFLNSVELDQTAPFIKYELYVTLPKNIMTDLHINNIEINPIPLYELDLTGIYVNKDNEFVSIKDFVPKTNMGNEFIVFESEYVNQLKFTFTQRAYDTVDQAKIFTFGLRKLDIRLLIVENNTFEWVSSYNLGTGRFYNVVYSPELESNGQYISLETKLYADPELTQEIDFNTELSVNTNKIYIKYRIESAITQIPIIYSEKIPYESRM